jgi:hypothetical protein
MQQELVSAVEGLGIDAAEFCVLEGQPSLLTFTVAGGDRAVNAWKTLRTLSTRFGCYPVICGNALEQRARLEEQVSDSTHSAESVLASVDGETPPLTQLQRVQEEQRRRMNDWLRSQGREPIDFGPMSNDTEVHDARGESESWPASPGRRSFALASVRDYKGKPFDRCLISLIPSIEPATALAYLHFGGWNDCPAPAIHVAYHRNWARRYSAEIVCVTSDVIECVVAQPPQTPDQAKQLSREQFLYCTDIVSQGTGSLDALAIGLWDSPSWYFWWD